MDNIDNPIEINDIDKETDEILVNDVYKHNDEIHSNEETVGVFGNISDEDYDKERDKRGGRIAVLTVIIVVCLLLGAISAFFVCHFFHGNEKSNSSNINESVISGDIQDDANLTDSEDNKTDDNDGDLQEDTVNTDNSEIKNNDTNNVSIDGVTELSAAEVYKACVNSVVGITAEGTTTNIFGQVSKNASTGTGIIYSSDGYILTNYHVVENGSSFTVTLYNGESYKANLVGYAEDNDVALIKIDAKGLQNAHMGNSDKIEVGKDVIVIGNPLGELTYTLTRGVVSALNRIISTDGTPKNMFQIDAAVNSGNSGGPAFDATGKVIGIVTAKYSADTVEGIGFCIPINDAIKIAEELKEYGYIRGKTAIGICAVDSYLTYGYGWFNQGALYGAKVTYVSKAFNVAKSGLSVGDLIVAVDDTRITSSSDLQTIIKSYSVGESIKITAYHADDKGSYEEVSYTLKVGEYTPDIVPENWTKDKFGEAV